MGREGEGKDILTSHRADPEEPEIYVLLVDDSKAFLRAAADLVRRLDGLVLVGAICGHKQAVDQAQSLGPQMILIGLNASSLETITRLRRALSDVGIIALTLLEGDIYRQAVMAAGADDLVRKAELVTDLLPAIRRVTQINRSR